MFRVLVGSNGEGNLKWSKCVKECQFIHKECNILTWVEIVDGLFPHLNGLTMRKPFKARLKKWLIPTYIEYDKVC